jgi:hypothetical protein
MSPVHFTVVTKAPENKGNCAAIAVPLYAPSAHFRESATPASAGEV